MLGLLNENNELLYNEVTNEIYQGSTRKSFLNVPTFTEKEDYMDVLKLKIFRNCGIEVKLI